MSLPPLWDGLLEGRYSVVYRDLGAGRLRCLIVENPEESRNLRALTPLEQRVAEGVARGDSDTALGFDIGLERSSISNVARRALRKLGLTNRAQLCYLLASLKPPRARRRGASSLGE